jgi:hypothetical protein
MIPSVGATSGTFITWPSSPIRLRPVTTATIAVAIGNGIAAAVPNVTSRMMIAATMPTISLVPVSGFETSSPRYPPTATVIPASRAGSAASMISLAWSTSRSSGPMVRRSEM